LCGEDSDCNEAGQLCFDSRCALSACERVICPLGEQCETGMCVPDTKAPQTTDPGCGCATTTRSSDMVWALLLLALFHIRRRRNRSTKRSGALDFAPRK
jgi:MYXO-CTERM domain-containing protein